MRLAPLAALLVAAGCTDAYLLDPDVGKHGAEDRAVRLTGEFCTEPASDIVRPIKIVVAMDTSQSMAVTDPDGTRARALIDLLENLPDSPEVYVGVFLFAGDITWLTNGGTSGFVPVQSLSASDRGQLAATLLTYAYAGDPNGPNRDTTDFVKPLDEIFATVSRDISDSERAAVQSGKLVRASYSAIFLSDGHPRVDEDVDIAVRARAIRSLSSEAGTVRLNTVHVFLPAQPVPTSCPDPTSCQEKTIEDDAARLRGMAELGGGEFRSFRNGEPINFLAFRLGGTRRAFAVKEALAFNLSARPGSLEPDSDLDGLSDAQEALLGTDPKDPDTDRDGFSDGVEQYFVDRGGKFRPGTNTSGSTYDEGCPPNLQGVDADRDGLLDCDEQLLGTVGNDVDSDHDGLPDVVEWLGGTQPATPDAEEDPDRDGLTNAVELRMHTDPNVADLDRLSDRAYRYQLALEATGAANGQACYAFDVDNVALVRTLDLGKGAGVNRVLFTVAQVPFDDPDAKPVYRVARATARFPLDGIKDPPDGVLPFTAADFEAP